MLRLARYAFAGAVLAAGLTPDAAFSQSGTRGGGRFVPRREPIKLTDEQRDTKPAAPPVTRSYAQARAALALEGYDPVVLVRSSELVPGVDGQQSTFDGQIYRFSTPSQKQAFDAAPEKYAVVLAGDSVVALRDQKKLVAGTAKFHTVFGGRLYLFATQAEKDAFEANPANYADVDLAVQGFSPVTLVDKEALQRGNKEFQITFDGRRILVADKDEKAKFLADPGKYYPTLGGLDPVSITQSAPVPGLARFSIVYKNRLYVLSSTENRQKFLKDPKPYSDVDVAIKGYCPVVAVETRKTEPGHYGISAIYLGQRYLFANEANRKRFEEDSVRFVRELKGVAN